MGGRRIALISSVVVLGSLVVAPLAHADAPANDDVADAQVVEALAFDADVDLTEATVETGEPDCYGWAYSSPPEGADPAVIAARRPNPLSLGLKASHDDPSGITTNTVWYSYESLDDVRIVVDTLGSEEDQDTVLAVYEESEFGLTTVGCNDDTGGLGSRVVFDAHAGHRYLVQLGAYDGNATSARLHMDEAPPQGLISGTVTDDDTGEPIADICVDVFGDGGGGWDVTDADGGYSVVVDPGDVRVSFFDCGWWYDDESYYDSEYYDDVQDYEDAMVLTVQPDGAIVGVDAGLTLSPGNPWGGSDLAITALDIDHAVLQVDGAVAPVGPGTSRIVRVDVANLGDSAGAGDVGVSVCPVSTPDYCSYLDPQYVRIDAAGTQALTFDWSGVGTVGDVTVTAFVDTCGGYGEDWNNNEMSRRDYVTLGGTGAGVGVGTLSWGEYGGGCYYWVGSSSAQP